MRVGYRQNLSRLHAISQTAFAALSRAIDAAKHLAAILHAVTNNFAPATIAFRRHLLNCAFEAVEDMRFSAKSYLECLVVIVSTLFAFSHKDLLHSSVCFRLVSS